MKYSKYRWLWLIPAIIFYIIGLILLVLTLYLYLHLAPEASLKVVLELLWIWYIFSIAWLLFVVKYKNIHYLWSLLWLIPLIWGIIITFMPKNESGKIKYISEKQKKFGYVSLFCLFCLVILWFIFFTGVPIVIFPAIIAYFSMTAFFAMHKNYHPWIWILSWFFSVIGLLVLISLPYKEK